MLDDLSEALHENAVNKGFWPDKVDDVFIAKQCMMIVSEVTELMEAIRKEKGEEEVASETADILIRTLDLFQGMKRAGYHSRSLDEALNAKALFNKTRPERHGVRF